MKTTKRKLSFAQHLEPRLAMAVVDCSFNPTWEAECAYFDTLIPDASATITAVQSGAWSNPATWSGNRLPAAGDTVRIPQGDTVMLDMQETSPLAGVLDEGSMIFATNVNTSLLVGTFIVEDNNSTLTNQDPGSLTIGTQADPIQPGVTATLTFTPFYVTAADPKQMGGGLISHGITSIYGNTVTPYEDMGGAQAGATTIQLDAVPTGWKPGDTLLFPGDVAPPTLKTTHPFVPQDEQIKIASITGTTVTLASPLQYSHTAPAGQTVEVADEARNVVVQSQNASSPATNGHVMFMHTDDVAVGYADFLNLGRTDKTQPLSATNILGRYALHFHRDYADGQTNNDAPIQVVGNYEAGSPGWGYVNHSSNVAFSDNVAYNNVGASFADEAGDELGSFDSNLAVYSPGGNRLQNNTTIADADFGFQGVGYWFQGGNVSVTNNIATGDASAGFFFFTQGLVQAGLGTTTIPGDELTGYPWATSTGTYNVTNVPIKLFDGNSSFATNSGLQTWFHDLNTPATHFDTISNFTAWDIGPGISAATGTGIQTSYTGNMTLKDVDLIGNVAAPSLQGITNNVAPQSITYDHVNTTGFSVGIQLPFLGTVSVVGGTFDDVTGILVGTAAEGSGTVSIQDASPTDPVVFLHDLGVAQTDIVTTLATLGQNVLQPLHHDLTVTFAETNPISTSLASHPGAQLYYMEQEADLVPFPTTVQPDASGFAVPLAASYIPAELLNKTNAQIFSQYGMAVGGYVAPLDAKTYDHVFGLIGSTVTPPLVVSATSPEFTNNLTGYFLSYSYTNPATGRNVPTKETVASPLHAGWNLLTRSVLGQNHTFLVYGDVTPPTFAFNPSQKTTVPKTSVAAGASFSISGVISDDSTDPMNYSLTIKLNDPTYITDNGDGTLAMQFPIKDLAGNVTIVKLTLTET